MLSKLNLTNVIWPNDEYFVFGTKPFHLFHLSNSKALEECTVVYFTTGERHLRPLENEPEGKKRKPNKRSCCTVVTVCWLFMDETFQ